MGAVQEERAAELRGETMHHRKPEAGAVADAAGIRNRQPYVGPGSEAGAMSRADGACSVRAHIRPIGADRRPRLGRSDGYHHQTAYEGGAVRLLRNPRIEIDIGYRDRLAVHHGPAG